MITFQVKALLSKISIIQSIRDASFVLHKRKTYAQHGEDLFVLMNIFNSKNNGTYLDIGASHPARLSNTYLMYQLGWTGTLIEPIKSLASKLKKWRPKDEVLQAAVGITPGTTQFYELFPKVLSTTVKTEMEKTVLNNRGILLNEFEVETMTLVEIFDTIDHCIDFLSMDVEGLDSKIIHQLGDIPFTKRPHAVCIEANTDEDEIKITNFLVTLYAKSHRIGCNVIAWQKKPIVQPIKAPISFINSSLG